MKINKLDLVNDYKEKMVDLPAMTKVEVNGGP